jgi:hypothetical protein
MQLIPTAFTERNFAYRQIERRGNLAIYTQTHQASGVQRYEVVRIRIARETTWPNGNITPEHEAYPGATSWGRDGFTCFSLEEARSLLTTWASRITEEVDGEPSEAAVSPPVEGARA